MVLEYSLFACGRRGSFSLFPCFRIRVGGVIYVCGRVSGGGVRFACRQNQKMFTDVDAGDADALGERHVLGRGLHRHWHAIARLEVGRLAH